MAWLSAATTSPTTEALGPRGMWLSAQGVILAHRPTGPRSLRRYTHAERKTGFVGTDHGDLWRYDGCARYVNNSWHIGFSNTQFADDFR